MSTDTAGSGAYGPPVQPEAALPAGCRVCGRGAAPVCHRCHHRMAEQLALLPVLTERLIYALVPSGGAPSTERVSVGVPTAPLPVRLSALTLLGAGTDQARCVFVPAVRVWATVEQVPTAADGAMQSVPLWHRELVYDDAGRPVLVAVDDQVSVLPVHEWVRSWADEWRSRLGGERVINPIEVDDDPGGTADWVRHDPVAQEWRERFGVREWTPGTRRHHDYLTTWLGFACAEYPHIDDFAVSLRSLSGAISAALGEHADLEYLGRCPQDRHDPVTGTTHVCGAALWHDPYTSVIACPRCRSETDPAGRVWLARRILEAWPIDRRRRYPRDLIDALRPVPCVTCGVSVSVEWIEATERDDRQRFWRPGSIACSNGCEVVESMAQSRAWQESQR